MKNVLYCSIFFLMGFYAHADEWNNFLNEVKGGWDQFSGGTVNFFKGMGQGFGYVTKDYHYSFKVFNDASAPIVVAEQKLTDVQGATFTGKTTKAIQVAPFTDTQDEFLNRQLYFNVVILRPKYVVKPQGPKKTGYQKFVEVMQWNAYDWIKGIENSKKEVDEYKLLKRTIYPWNPNDNTVYFYHTYNQQGDLKAEYLGMKGITEQFSGQFVNNTKSEVLLAFSKDGKKYSATLESATFAMLASNKDIPNSIRPKKSGDAYFIFNDIQGQEIAKIPITSKGIANMIFDEKSQQFELGDSMLYTFEIFQGAGGPQVGMQGLAMGNYQQPVHVSNAPSIDLKAAGGEDLIQFCDTYQAQAKIKPLLIRDINPCECLLWYMTEEQVQAQQANQKETQGGSIPFSSSGQIWIIYKTHDYSFQEKLTPGQVLKFSLLRPTIQEKTGTLYVVEILTNNDVQSKNFLERLANGQIGSNLTTYRENIDAQSPYSLIKPNTNGLVDDSQGTNASGVSGYVLGIDTFKPRGVGTGPFYYMLPPARLQIDQLTTLLYLSSESYQKDSTELDSEILKDLTNKFQKWIKNYEKNTENVRKEVEEYLKQQGNSTLFVQGSRVLNEQGKAMVQAVVDGPISIAYYPLIRNVVTNYYLYGFGKKPDNWPEVTK